mgnify:CR=1 FL=1
MGQPWRNKRAGLAATLLFLELNGISTDVGIGSPAIVRPSISRRRLPGDTLAFAGTSLKGLDDTLVILAGEFGRTIYCQGKLKRDDYGRDHHPRCFTMWMAGGGIRGGTIYGETDDFSVSDHFDTLVKHVGPGLTMQIQHDVSESPAQIPPG